MSTDTPPSEREPDPLSAFCLLPEDEPDAKPEPEWEPPPWPDDCPAVGIYPDVSYEDYAAWPALNATALKIGYKTTPLHLKAAMNGVFGGDSRDRKFGRAAHCRLLEPEFYRTRFLISGPCPVPVKSGPRAGQPCGNPGKFQSPDGAWYCGSHAKAIADAVEPVDYLDVFVAARIERLADAVKAHKVVRLLRQHGGCEVSLVWDRDGLPCKARLDKLIPEATCPATVLDLKKGQPCKLTEEDLQKSIRDWGSDIQAYWYTDGVYRIIGKRPLFAWIYMEDSEPFDVRPVWASRAMLEVGRIKAERAFGMYRDCTRWGHWPGYCDDIEELDPATWEMKRYSIGG